MLSSVVGRPSGPIPSTNRSDAGPQRRAALQTKEQDRP